MRRSPQWSRSLTSPMLIDRASLVVAHLLQPEARRRTVEEPKQGEVIVLGCTRPAADHRGRLFEHFPAPVQHEMVVRGDLAEDDRQWSAVFLRDPTIPCPPFVSAFQAGLTTEGDDRPDCSSHRPHPSSPLCLCIHFNGIETSVVWREGKVCHFNRPIANGFSDHKLLQVGMRQLRSAQACPAATNASS